MTSRILFSAAFGYFTSTHLVSQDGDSKDSLSVQFSSRIQFGEWMDTHKEIYAMIAPLSMMHLLDRKNATPLADDRLMT
jgi:hypothetical protein